jgi:hypothetical protein
MSEVAILVHPSSMLTMHFDSVWERSIPFDQYPSGRKSPAQSHHQPIGRSCRPSRPADQRPCWSLLLGRKSKSVYRNRSIDRFRYTDFELGPRPAPVVLQTERGLRPIGPTPVDQRLCRRPTKNFRFRPLSPHNSGSVAALRPRPPHHQMTNYCSSTNNENGHRGWAPPVE